MQEASVRFSFALMVCALAILLEFFLDRVTGGPISPFLPGFAAIIASAAWAGAGPGLAATFLLVNWAGFSLWRQGTSFSGISMRCLVFAVEGALLSVGSSRMWRSMHDAARSETWHRRLVETASEGIWVHDERGVITYANARMAGILGVTLEQLIGHNVDEFFFPADLSVERIRAASLRHGRKEQFDRRLRRGDGTEAWVLTCCNMMSVNDEISGPLAMMTDITERKRAESALRLSEERFRNLYESVLEGVYQSTPDGRIVAANPMLLEILGLTTEADLNDINIAKDLYADPGVRQRLMNDLEREGVLRNFEYELRRRDGKIITILENARVVRDGNGAVLYYEGTLTDITPRKRMEEQLREAQKMEALGNLAGTVAEDFSNVLTVITGSSEIALADLPAGHPARSSIEQVLRAAGHAVSVTRQLVTFSRNLAPGEGSIDLNHALKHAEAVGKFDPAISISPASVPVYASERRIDLMLRRLSETVQRSAPAARIEWKVRVARVDEELRRLHPEARPGLYAVLTVKAVADADEGANGVRELFGPAFRVMTSGESAGMGLAEMHAAVTQCDGFVIANGGAEGPPASYHVFLPSVDEKAGGAAEPKSGGETILLVEGEPLIRELSRDMLERQGYRVILATNAQEAERIGTVAGKIDLLIADIAMAGATGAELAHRLRAAQSGMKTLLISGYADTPLEHDVDEEDNATVLQRPFSAESLGRKIREVLGGD